MREIDRQLLEHGDVATSVDIPEDRIQEHLDAVGRAFAAQTEALKAGPGERSS